jgi:protein-S-isoprenylcysteine O-methyltransferase Ste14
LAVRIGILAVVVLLFNTKIGEAFARFRFVNFTEPLYGSIAAFLAASGVAFAIWARIHLGRNWGMPMTIKEKPQLITSGPYSFVRHPIYTGVLIAILGSVFLSGIMYIAIFIAAVLYFYYSSKKEEEVLTKTFPKEYPAYIKRTKMLIPFLF